MLRTKRTRRRDSAMHKPQPVAPRLSRLFLSNAPPTRPSSFLLLLLLCHALLAHAAVVPQRPFRAPKPHEIQEPQESHGGLTGAVASESKECSAIGRDLLARGGNAADAAVGTTLCVGVVAMYHAGIGGGGFALVRDARGNYEAVDFRETAPAAAHQDMFLHNIKGSTVGGLAVGVPGEVRGLEYIHNKYGILPWHIVVQGSVDVARHGFRVSKDLLRRIVDSEGKPAHDFLLNDPSFAQDFAPHGTLLGEGDLMTRKRYADVLEKIAQDGADAFYTGDIAKAMVEQIQRTNGTMTLQDMQDYSVVSRPVYSTRFRDLDLYTMGAPASGVVGLNMLKTMEQYGPHDDDGNGLAAHRFTEAMRFAYGARVDLADPAFVGDQANSVNNVTALEHLLLDDIHAQQTRHRISDRHTKPVCAYDPGARYAPDGHGTSHIVTADKSGVAVSLTSTVNLIYGAHLMEPMTGIILNNEMDDFSIPGFPNAFGFQPSPANFVRPGKRPLSSVTPVIAAYPNGTLRAVVGASGGSRIISATAATLWHFVDHAMTMADAVREPRMHDQLMPNTVMLEPDFDEHVAASLADKGHNVTRVSNQLSAVQGIARLYDGTFDAVGEPRQKNSAGLVL